MFKRGQRHERAAFPRHEQPSCDTGDALICHERRSTSSVDELRGFTQEEVERLRDLIFRQTGRGRG
jgi:hypothetical protein